MPNQTFQNSTTKIGPSIRSWPCITTPSLTGPNNTIQEGTRPHMTRQALARQYRAIWDYTKLKRPEAPIPFSMKFNLIEVPVACPAKRLMGTIGKVAVCNNVNDNYFQHYFTPLPFLFILFSIVDVYHIAPVGIKMFS